MAADSYAACPGGLDKKVKFCCPDLTSELDKVQRMIAADQRLAASDALDKLLEKHPDRACLCALKTLVLASQDKEPELRQAVQQFVERFPANPIALAEQSLFVAAEQGPEAGVLKLQEAWEQVGHMVPRQLYDAVGAMAVALLSAARPMGALGHLFLQATLDREDREPLALIARVMASPSVPLLMKDDRLTQRVTKEVPWKAEFEATLIEAARGRWRKATVLLNELSAKQPVEPAIWQNLSILNAWLADNTGAIQALRRLAALAIPFDDAVEAEALAQVLDPATNEAMIDIVAINNPIEDMDRLTEALLSDDRVLQIPVDRQLIEEGQPPPRSTFLLLDRAMPKSGVDLPLKDVPRVIGTAAVYGKQTDRDARLELMSHRGDELPLARQLIADIGGKWLGEAVGEVVLDRVPALRNALQANWKPPEDTPPERVRQLSDEHRRETIFERWPRLSQSVLNGKSPLEAKDDPSCRIRLAAAMLLLELEAEQEGADLDFNPLRQKLGLPAAAEMPIEEVNLVELRLARFARVPVEKLSDEQLISLYQRAASAGMRRVLRRIAAEIIARPSLEAKVDLSEVFNTLVYLAEGDEAALQYVEQARTWAEKKGQSSARWDLEELGLRLSRLEGDEASRLMDHLIKEHINENGVRQALAEILRAAGIIGPDGRPTHGMPGAEPPGMRPAESAVEPGKIWTPDGERGDQQKSKLWVPGMD